MQSIVIMGIVLRLSAIYIHFVIALFFLIYGLWTYPNCGQPLLLVSTVVCKFLFLTRVNQFFGFILLVFKLCRD